MEDVYKYVDAVKLYMTNFTSIGIKVRIGFQDELDDDVVFIESIQPPKP